MIVSGIPFLLFLEGRGSDDGGNSGGGDRDACVAVAASEAKRLGSRSPAQPALEGIRRESRQFCETKNIFSKPCSNIQNISPRKTENKFYKPVIISTKDNSFMFRCPFKVLFVTGLHERHC